MNAIQEKAHKIAYFYFVCCLEKAKKLYPVMKDASITFKTCRGRCAGLVQYNPLTNSIVFKINIEMMCFSEKSFIDMIEDTIPHEMAHVVDFMIRGESSHDEKWRRIAKSLGCTGNRCHTNETRYISGTYLYNVYGTTVKVKKSFHQKIMNGTGKVYFKNIEMTPEMFVREKSNDYITDIPEKFKEVFNAIT